VIPRLHSQGEKYLRIVDNDGSFVDFPTFKKGRQGG
jgi:hypothetical protein